MGHLADVSRSPSHVRSPGAGSTGRRNTSVQSLCWGFKLQGLAWSLVELTSHFVQIGLRIHRQVGALREVLSQQAIGVLVRPALPWALRIAKIYVDFGRQTVNRELGGVVQRGERPMARELEGKVAVVTGAASGIGLASTEAMLAGGSRVVMVDRDEAALKALCNKHGDAVIPLVIDLLDPKDCYAAAESPREDRPTRHPACKCGYVHWQRLGRCRHWGYRPDAELECQRRDEECARRASSHDRASDGRHYRHEFLGGPFSDAMGAGICVVQMGDQLLCPDGATSGVQARHSRGLNLAWPRHQRTARGLAAEEAEGSQGVRKSAGGQRSGQRGDVHVDAATQYDDSRRGHAAHQFRSLGHALISVRDACQARTIQGRRTGMFTLQRHRGLCRVEAKPLLGAKEDGRDRRGPASQAAYEVVSLHALRPTIFLR